MLARYWVTVSCSRSRRDRRTSVTGSSDGNWMALPVASCSVNFEIFSWLNSKPRFMVASNWLLAMRMVCSLAAEHRQGGVEQGVGDGDHLHIGLVHILVGHQVDGFLVRIDAAGRLPVVLGLVADGGGGGQQGLVLLAVDAQLAHQLGVGIADGDVADGAQGDGLVVDGDHGLQIGGVGRRAVGRVGQLVGGQRGRHLQHAAAAVRVVLQQRLAGIAVGIGAGLELCVELARQLAGEPLELSKDIEAAKEPDTSGWPVARLTSRVPSVSVLTCTPTSEASWSICWSRWSCSADVLVLRPTERICWFSVAIELVSWLICGSAALRCWLTDTTWLEVTS